MIFFPVAFLIFVGLLLSLPALFFLGYFRVITLGFEKLGISPEITLLILFLILVGSAINIPLTKKKITYAEERRFFGLFRSPKIEQHFLALNLGGAVIPLLISFYFIFLGWQRGINLEPVLIAIVLMIIISKFLARLIPGRGVVLPFLAPPIFSAVLAMIFTPNFAAPTAFISGVIGVLIGADILNLRSARRYGGVLSIGGAGVFDGIFLVGVVASLLAGF